MRPPHLEADIEAVPVGLAAGGLGLGLRMRVLWRGEEGEREREGRQGEAGRPGADRRRPAARSRPRKRPVRCGHAGFLRGPDRPVSRRSRSLFPSKRLFLEVRQVPQQVGAAESRTVGLWLASPSLRA